ncbi:MAG TPA: hypothetical protein ENK75_00190, partial [Saprospiraceae bacterium]|nr:hypothetical protein [Saprospiraceae bacterium]
MISGYLYYISNVFSIFSTKKFQGWGRKKTGQFALWCHKKFGGKLTLFEDGFIRSIGLGVNRSPSFSRIVDDIGIYYDATTPSKLENILKTYDFSTDKKLIRSAKKAIELIIEHHISKYNKAPDVNDDFFKDDLKSKVLIVAQTAGDASLEYGRCNEFSTRQMINDALQDNPDSSVYLKINPDVLIGK